MIHKKLLLPTGAFILLASAAFSQTTFNSDGTSIFDGANWDNGLPNSGGAGTINGGTGTGSATQSNTWISGSSVTIGGGAVLTLGTDFGATGGTATVNDATVNATDDVFSGTNGTIIFNSGSASSAGDDFQAQGGGGTITIHGGTHTAGDLVGSQSGTNSFNMTGGQITAGNYQLDGDSNSIGGSAVLLSEDGTAVLSMLGATDITSDWTGSWNVGSFSGTAWRDELIGGGWTFDSAAIDGAVFDANFSVSGDGATLSLVPEPSTFGVLIGLFAMTTSAVLRRRK
ncbi:PEP-CTERM sorting domain-containing protein [Coraliomargarita parva]|uniref:PEP-CTERM sorting domain-containing protein n=1 Tax=Coraliomargarita parva TaxID=3014050 RepID=UPI0022B47633|nr:PEP-CTERM sorting domain-containing protein [Coraliomargarita parva]